MDEVRKRLMKVQVGFGQDGSICTTPANQFPSYEEISRILRQDLVESGTVFFSDSLDSKLAANPMASAPALPDGMVRVSGYKKFTKAHVSFTDDDAITAAKQAGAREERERILALMRELRPLDETYSRRDWALEQKGAKELLDKLACAVQSGRQPKGDAQ